MKSNKLYAEIIKRTRQINPNGETLEETELHVKSNDSLENVRKHFDELWGKE